jgi:large subunit ribosomal protein L31
MKKKIHPKWYPDAVVKCACGNAFKTGSTQPVIEVEICADCHPFFTGEAKYVDTLGRVEKFQKKQASASKVQAKKKKKIEEQKRREQPRTLKEMLSEKA